MSKTSHYVEIVTGHQVMIFNVTILVCGLVALTTGSLITMSINRHIPLYYDSVFQVAILLIGFGCLAIIISILGCYGALFEFREALGMYAGVVCVIFLMEFMGSLASFYFICQMDDFTVSELNVSLDYFGNYSDVRRIWNTMQQNDHCCGAFNYTDWTRVVNYSNTNDVPDSCCLRVTPGCGHNGQDNQTAIYTVGCIQKVTDILYEDAVITGSVSLVISLIQLFTVVLAGCIAWRRNEQEIEMMIKSIL